MPDYHSNEEEQERKHNQSEPAAKSLPKSIDSYCTIFEQDNPNSDSLFELMYNLSNSPDAEKAPLPPLTSCAIQGGGAKGAAYAGTYEAMEKLGVTETTTEYCGASAGAITDFLIGLGYDAEQFKAASDSMNFLDLNDFNASMFGRKAGGTKLSMLASVATQGFVHTGEGFHNWARAQCAMVFGNPDMTFAEMETWCKTQIPPVPVPNMKFMGTALDKEDANSVCFSLENTPNVVIADSVRASMSFPGAFKKFPVRQKNTAGELEELGNFADGGILNNYPLDQLSTPATAHSAYTLPKVHNIDGKLESMNPGAYGLSLTTHVQDTNKHKTGFSESKRLKKLKGRPIDDRESARLEEAEKQEEAFKARQVAAQAQKGGAFKKIAHVLRKNFMGDTPTSIKDNLKKRVFKNQTVLIYTEGVATLEFQVSPKKKELIEASGKIAFINWFIEHRDPTQNYDDFFKKTHQGKAEENSYDPKKFSGDAVLDQEDNEFISQNIVPTNQQESLPDIKKYVRCMIDFHDELNNVRKIQKYLSKSEIMDELIEDQKEKLAKFSDINNNQRLKHLAWQLKQLEVKPEFKKNTQIKKQAIELIKARKIRHAAKKQALKDNLKKNISIEELVEKIHAHLAKDQPKDTQLALTIFKGQLSNVFKLMRSDPTLLSKLAERCDADQLQELLENIGRTAEQLEQQDRVFHQNYGLLAKLERETFENFNARFALYLTTVTDPSLLTQAILQQDSKKIAYLLSRSYINPLETSNDGKNALHACVERADVDTFEKIIKQFNCRDLSYDTQGNTILHYIIQKSNPDFIHKLLEKPKIKAWIKDLQKNDPECRAAFGLGETLKDQIIHKAKNNPALNLPLINQVFHYTPKVTAHTPKESDKNQAKIRSEKNKLLSILGAETMSVAVLNSYLSPPNKLDKKTALTLLTTPFNASNQTLIELAASDGSAEKRYTKLALALLNKCEESEKNKTKLKALFHSKFSGNKSLLYLAIEHNNAEFVDVCLKYQSSINHAGPHECVSALTCAARLGYVDLVKKLMNSKKDYSRALPDKEGKNALHYLAKQEHPKASPDLLFKLLTKSSLITAGQTKKVDVPDATGKTVLDYLFRLNRLDIIQKITSQSTLRTWKLNDYFEGLFTPHLPGGQTSLEYLANLASTGSEHRALFIYVLKNISKRTKMKQDSQGKTPLHYLAVCSKEEISAKEFVDFLKSKKTTFHTSAKYHRRTNIEDNKGNSVLRALIENNRADIIAYLQANWSGWKLNAIFDLHTVRADGLSDMEYIQQLQANNPNLEILIEINKFLPNCMQKADNGEPKFHNEIVSNTRTASEIWASLHSAITTSSPTGIRERQADYTDVTSLRNNAGKTSFRLLIDNDRIKVIAEIAKHSAFNWRLDHYFNLNLRDEQGVTDLEYALTNASTEIKNHLIKNLSTKSLLSNQNDSNRKSVLHYIAQDKNIDPRLFWQTMRKNKPYIANTNIEDVNGKTPFRVLIENNRTDILADIARHCGKYASGTWRLEHYFDFTMKRQQDGLTDLACLIIASKENPKKYKKMLDIVKLNTTPAVFEQANMDAKKALGLSAAAFASVKEQDDRLFRGMLFEIKNQKTLLKQEKHGINLPEFDFETPMRQAVSIFENLIENRAYLNKNSAAYQKFAKLMAPLNEMSQKIVLNFIIDTADKIDKEYDIIDKFKGLTPNQTFSGLVLKQFGGNHHISTQSRIFAPQKEQKEKEAKHKVDRKDTLQTPPPPLLKNKK